MRHKKLIVFVVVLAMALAAAAAYAWWSTTITSDTNNVATGHIALAMSGLPIDASGLVPQNAPEEDAEDSEYADVTYFWVKNDSSMPLMFYGWLSDGSDTKNIRSYVRARIWLLGDAEPPDFWTGIDETWVGTFQTGGPYDTFDGTVAQLWSAQTAGINYLSSRYWDSAWHRTLFEPGEYAVYRVAIWLDGSAPDSTQDATLSFKINFTGMQEEAWEAAGYDLDPYVP